MGLVADSANSGLFYTILPMYHLTLVAVRLSGILKGKQKLGLTFNSDKQDIIDFTKFSKPTKWRASEA